MYPLSMANEGETVVIQRITGRSDVCQRLASMGFVIGSEITVVSRNGDDMILQVKGSRVALGSGMTKRIMVGQEEKDENSQGCKSR